MALALRAHLRCVQIGIPADLSAECGTAARPAQDDTPPAASLFMVMQVIVDELEKIDAVMKSLDHK
ncbi:hypothetical protein SIID45300_02295 [Candidatus Magnetaquicoccaceae bacterium FCR-1]|uniref:Uncharacterized protein n=1 Tax=Candidatus Magnetaquiglobus chichijimensis TaxID=3141448 RepID=A0ABQ0CAP2_9PROT